MKRFVVVLIFMLVVFPLMSVMAAESTPGPSVPESILEVFTVFGALAGVSALISVGVNFLKSSGVVKDGQSGTVFAIANLVAMGFVILIRLYLPGMAVTQIDAEAGNLAKALEPILFYILQIMAGQKFYDIVKTLQIPVLGFSFNQKE